MPSKSCFTCRHPATNDVLGFSFIGGYSTLYMGGGGGGGGKYVCQFTSITSVG